MFTFRLQCGKYQPLVFFTKREKQRHLAGVLFGLEANATLSVLLPLRTHSLPNREQTLTTTSLNRSQHVSVSDDWFDYGFHGRQNRPINIDLVNSSYKTKKITALKLRVKEFY